MAKKADLSKIERVKKEERRLKNIYKNILEEKKRKVVDGLIYRAAFMRIQLEDYENDLTENGYTEMFSQSDKLEPYERERPVARLYNSTNKNYQSIIKQLSDLLPKEKLKKGDDGFDNFVNDR